MTCRIEVHILGISGGVLPAEVADMFGRNILSFVGRHIGDIDQIQRCGIDEILCAGQPAQVAFGDAHEFPRLGVVAVDAFGEKGIDADRIERQRRRSRQTAVGRTVDAPCGPHDARKLFERKRLRSVFTP